MTDEVQRNEKIRQWIADNSDSMQETSDFIFNHPEISLEEKKSSRCLAEFLEKNGFTITWGIWD